MRFLTFVGFASCAGFLLHAGQTLLASSDRPLLSALSLPSIETQEFSAEVRQPQADASPTPLTRAGLSSIVWPNQLGQVAQQFSYPLLEFSLNQEVQGSFSEDILPVLNPIFDLPQWLSANPNAVLSSAVVAKTEQGRFQVWLRGQLIAEMPDRVRAKLLSESLARLLDRDPDLNGDQVQPAIAAGVPVGRWGDYILFAIDPELQSRLGRGGQQLAIEWTNNIRVALGAEPLSMVDSQIALQGLVKTGDRLEGLASWYGPYFHGRQTATGEIFNQHDFTAAHRSLPFNTYLKVTNLANGRTVVVRINDRGPYISGRTLDLSLGTARYLGSEQVGVMRYRAEILKPLS